LIFLPSKRWTKRKRKKSNHRKINQHAYSQLYSQTTKKDAL